MGGPSRRSSDGDSSSNEEDGDAEWKAAIDSIATTTIVSGGNGFATTPQSTIAKSVAQSFVNAANGEDETSHRHYQVKFAALKFSMPATFHRRFSAATGELLSFHRRSGFIGACFHVAWALWVYLVVMLFLIVGLMGITIFGFIVTSQGGGLQVPGRVYREYHLHDYSPWLRNRIIDPGYWTTIRSCIFGSKTCSKLAYWTPLDYLERDMTPIQSGCCKPPTSCNYNMATTMTQDQDCYRWNNSPTLLCYECDSCKAGVLESMRRDWHKLSVLNIVMLVFLIGIYCIGCSAFQNTKRAETDYPYGENRMTKVRPRWDYYWWRWWHDKRESLY